MDHIPFPLCFLRHLSWKNQLQQSILFIKLYYTLALSQPCINVPTEIDRSGILRLNFKFFLSFFQAAGWNFCRYYKIGRKQTLSTWTLLWRFFILQYRNNIFISILSIFRLLAYSLSRKIYSVFHFSTHFPLINL